VGLEFYSGVLAGVGVVLIGSWIRDRARYRSATGRHAGTAPATALVGAVSDFPELGSDQH
jgi:hypothetical protein